MDAKTAQNLAGKTLTDARLCTNCGYEGPLIFVSDHSGNFPFHLSCFVTLILLVVCFPLIFLQLYHRMRYGQSEQRVQCPNCGQLFDGMINQVSQ